MSETNFKSSKPCNGMDALIDERKFHFGEIWKIRDYLIEIPEADRMKNRKMHPCRPVIIADNNPQNYNKLSTTICILPTSHRTDLTRQYDVPLLQGKDEVKEDCIARTCLIQPVLKIDLYECVGKISTDAKDEIINAQLGKIGIDLDSL